MGVSQIGDTNICCSKTVSDKKKKHKITPAGTYTNLEGILHPRDCSYQRSNNNNVRIPWRKKID